VEADFASVNCNTNSASYSSATDWGALHLMTTPDPVVLLAEDTSRTDAAQITATWTYPIDVSWSLNSYYLDRSSNAPTHFDGADPLTHYVVKYYAQSRADLDKIDGTVVDAAFDPSGTHEVTLTDTAKGSTYEIGVTAVNSMGSSTEERVTIQQAEAPSVITNGETSQLIQTRLDLSFKKNYMRLMWWPDDDGGADVDTFEVKVWSVRENNWIEPTAC